MEAQQPTVGDLVSRTAHLVLETMPAALAAFALLTLFGTVIDSQTVNGSLNFVFPIASMIAAYVLTVKALDARGLLDQGKPNRGIGGMFMLSLLTGGGILLGLVLLVIPV